MCVDGNSRKVEVGEITEMGHTTAVDFVAAGRLCGALSTMANSTGIGSIGSEYKHLPSVVSRGDLAGGPSDQRQIGKRVDHNGEVDILRVRIFCDHRTA